MPLSPEEPGPPGLLEDRQDAGRRLAERLRKYWSHDVVVVGVARGGVVVAYPIAESLHAPLDLVVVRKVGLPENPEYGVGAIAEGGVERLPRGPAATRGPSEAELRPVLTEERLELERRVRVYREGRPRPDLGGRTVILVDDGAATGNTIEAAMDAVRPRGPGRLVLALGVCPPETFHRLGTLVDDLVVLLVPESFFAVGEWYRDFPPVSDSEVLRCLRRAHRMEALASP